MPTYEYRCKSCEHTFEEFQSMSAAPLRRCPKCGKGVERLMGTGAGIIFKGSGFYQTDYRSKSYQEKAKSESQSPADSAASAKPAKKEEPGPKNKK